MCATVCANKRTQKMKTYVCKAAIGEIQLIENMPDGMHFALFGRLQIGAKWVLCGVFATETEANAATPFIEICTDGETLTKQPAKHKCVTKIIGTLEPLKS